MAVLEDVKTELGISGTDKDAWITLQIRKGTTLIKNYMNDPDNPAVDIEGTYPDALVEYVLLRYRKRGNEGIKQFSQGSRSGTYGDELSDSVKLLLPMQPIRMRG